MFNTDALGNTYFSAGIAAGSYPITTTTPTHVLVAGAGGIISRVAVSQLITTTQSSSPVTSVFGRTGHIMPSRDDYSSSFVKEGSNLYFTNARSRAAISLTTVGSTGPATYDSVTGIINVPQYQNDFNGVNSFNTRTGAVTLTALDVTTALTYTPIAIETDPVWTAQKSLYYTKVESDAAFAAIGHTHTFASLTSKPTTLAGYGITDAATSVQGTNADTAFGWGNHALVGYLTSFTETDPTVPSHVKTITTTNITNWNTAYSWGNHALAGYLTSFTETDPIWTSEKANYALKTYVDTSISNLIDSAPTTLDTLNELAAALGDDANFSTSITTLIGTKEPAITAGTTAQYWRGDKTWQTLPIYTLSGLGGVPTSRTLTINGTSYDLSADRSWSINSMVYPSAGIAVSTGSAWGTSITDNSSNWNTAYGWGNHASAGYLTTATAASTYASLSGAYSNPAFVASLAWSKITGAPAFLTSYTETDPIYTASSWYGTTNNASNWNTAFSDRFKWDGGSSGLNASTGRTSLGLGTAATANTGDFAAASHTHSIANVSGLQTALDGKEPTITAGTTSQYWRGDKTWQTLPVYTLAGLGGQPQLNGTGFVKISGTTISYDNSTYYLASNPSGYITSSALSGYATQTWVQSQGYLTSVSDVWVNNSGDSMTGNLSFGSSGAGITWAANTDGASITFESTGDGASGSRALSNLLIALSDNGDEGLKVTSSSTELFFVNTNQI